MAEKSDSKPEHGAGRQRPPALEVWLSRHRRYVLGAMVALSIIFRIIYFVQLNRGPCVWLHRWDQTDMHFFHVWAREAAGGDWLTNKPLHPQHEWHRMVADACFRQRSGEAAGIAREGALGEGGREHRSRVLWNRWYGGKRFHQAPLYPYLIALTYRGFSDDVRWVFIWQMLLGVLSNVLVYLIARRCFGHVAGTVAGLLAVLCGPLLFYEMVLLRSALITFAGLALVFLTDAAVDRGAWRWWLLAGIAIGLALLAKTTFALFGLGALCLVACRHRGRPKALVKCGAAMAAGVAICLTPAVGRNVVVGAPAFGLSSVAAVTFACTNSGDVSLERRYVVSLDHVPRIMGQTGGRFVPAVIETMKTHTGIGSYACLLWHKFTATWHWYEQPNNVNLYYFRVHAGILRSLPVTFFLLAPLGLVGLALAAPGFRRCAALYLLVASSIVPLLMFWFLSRFRAPLVAALIPFAGLTLVRIVGWAWRRRVAWCATALISVLLLWLWTAQPLPANQPMIRSDDYCSSHSAYYDPMERRAREAGDWRAAAAIMGDFLRSEPAEVAQMGSGRAARSREERRLAALFAGAYYRRGVALRRLGLTEAAARHARVARELKRAARR